VIMPRAANTKGKADVLFVGTNRAVVALDARTGEELWRTKLPRQTGGIVSMLVSGPQLYAGCGGRVYCLDAGTGQINWENDLPRLGYHAVLLAMPGANCASSSEAAIAAWECQRRRAVAAGGAAAGGATSTS
jgi:outer membrane protein assembly factor BamB